MGRSKSPLKNPEQEPIEFEVFTSGEHLDGSCQWRRYSDADLDEIVSTYNPKHFRAPLLVTAKNDHAHPGSPEYVSEDPLLSHGIPVALKREGSKLKAVFDSVSEPFRRWVDEKRIPGFSVALYEPQDVRNPYPGKHALRHIATVLHPAVKGNGMPGFSEDDPGVEKLEDYDLSEGVAFGFSEGTETVAMLLGKLRDYLIEKDGREDAEKVLPAGLIQQIAFAAASPSQYADKWEVDDLRRRVERLETQEEEEIYMSENTAPTVSQVEASELEQQRAQLEADRAAFEEAKTNTQKELCSARAELARMQAAMYCEKTFSPEQLEPTKVEFSEGKPASVIDFVASLNEWQRPFFEEWVQRQPAPTQESAPVHDPALFSEVTGGTSNPLPKTERGDSEFDEASVDRDARIRAYATEYKCTYREAMEVVK